jgi:diamine N-acetyltransferase
MTTPATTRATVRPARPEEARALGDLAARTFPDACPPDMAAEDVHAFIDEHLSESAFAGYLADPRYLVLLAETPDAGPIGYTLVDTAPEEAPPGGSSTDSSGGPAPAYLSKMYVLDTARGTGAATALMRATLDAARRRGHRQAWLGVNRANVRANAFYEKLGFAVVGERTFPVGEATGHDYLRLVDLTEAATGPS